jgi:L-fuconate dehydratase
VTITAVDVIDVRFPTSRSLDGSDAMNPDPDYSAAYVVLHTDSGHEGHGFTFTIGRGNDLCCAAIETLSEYVIGTDVYDTADLGALYKRLTHDSQIRWLGPEKGVMHLAAAALVNAAWDLAARRSGYPLWKFLSLLTAEQVVECVDWRYLSDAITPDEALEILRAAVPGKIERIEEIEREGYPAYTTSPGWLGYDDEKVVRLAREAVAQGYKQIKLKVGADLEDDRRRFAAARSAVGPENPIAVDANQRWDVDQAVDWVKALAEFDPWWIEEPTSPDDVLGHALIRERLAPIKVATGEHVHNRVMFKQLLQAGAIDFLQMDAARVAGVNENLAILLLAAKFGVPVCPHALVCHLSMFDYTSVSASMEDRVIEYVDHLHEHFTAPTVIASGRYRAPVEPGFSAEMKRESLIRYSYPNGPEWRSN